MELRPHDIWGIRWSHGKATRSGVVLVDGEHNVHCVLVSQLSSLLAAKGIEASGKKE